MTNKSQQTPSLRQYTSKTFYHNCGKLVSMVIKFSLKKLFSNLPIFTKKKIFQLNNSFLRYK